MWEPGGIEGRKVRVPMGKKGLEGGHIGGFKKQNTRRQSNDKKGFAGMNHRGFEARTGKWLPEEP